MASAAAPSLRELMRQGRTRNAESRRIRSTDCAYVQQGNAGKTKNRMASEKEINEEKSATLSLISTSGVATCLGVAIWLEEKEHTHGLVAHLDSSHIGIELDAKRNPVSVQTQRTMAKIYVEGLFSKFPASTEIHVALIRSDSTSAELLEAVRLAFADHRPQCQVQEPDFKGHGDVDFVLNLGPQQISIQPYVEESSERVDRTAPSRATLDFPDNDNVHYFALIYQQILPAVLPNTKEEALVIKEKRARLCQIIDSRIAVLSAPSCAYSLCCGPRSTDTEKKIAFLGVLKDNLTNYPTISVKGHITEFLRAHPLLERDGRFCKERLFGDLLAADPQPMIAPETAADPLLPTAGDADSEFPSYGVR